MKKYFILITICLTTGLAAAQIRNNKPVLLEKSKRKVIISVKSSWVIAAIPGLENKLLPKIAMKEGEYLSSEPYQAHIAEWMQNDTLTFINTNTKFKESSGFPYFYGISCSADFLFPLAKTVTKKNSTQWGISLETGLFAGLAAYDSYYRLRSTFTGNFSILAGIDGITTFAGKENFYFSWGIKPVGYLFPYAFCGAFQLGTGWKLSPKVALEPIIGIQWIWAGTGLSNSLSCTTGLNVRFF
jgi:hypothetical protein